ncbi:MAG: hypothetical protein JWP61_1449 [Friedmanniella sp.]|nr:hypothetical protein [Friedmanniella sp.]
MATSGFYQGVHAGTDPLDAIHHTRRLLDDLRAPGR